MNIEHTITKNHWWHFECYCCIFLETNSIINITHCQIAIGREKGARAQKPHQQMTNEQWLIITIRTTKIEEYRRKKEQRTFRPFGIKPLELLNFNVWPWMFYLIHRLLHFILFYHSRSIVCSCCELRMHAKNRCVIKPERRKWSHIRKQWIIVSYSNFERVIFNRKKIGTIEKRSFHWSSLWSYWQNDTSSLFCWIVTQVISIFCTFGITCHQNSIIHSVYHCSQPILIH